MITIDDQKAITSALVEFLDAREGARKFHAARIGKGVDPDHCFADFLACVATNDRRRLAANYGVEPSTKAALAESSGTLGGYLVPQDLRDDLYATVEEAAIVRPRAQVVPMGSATMLLPRPDTETSQSAGVPPYFGGLRFYWGQESAARTEGEPAWRSLQLTAWELTGYALASNPWLADTSADAFLRKLFARAIAWHEDYAFLRQDGVGKPLGILPDAINQGASVSRASASDFKFADAASMIAKLLPSSWPRAIWVMHPLALAKMVSLATTTTVVWQANTARLDTDGPVGTLHMIPVYVSDKLPTLGTAGDVLLFDPTLYVIGDRLQVEIAASAHEPTAMLKNQTAFRTLSRLDGRPWLKSGILQADASTTCYYAVYLN